MTSLFTKLLISFLFLLVLVSPFRVYAASSSEEVVSRVEKDITIINGLLDEMKKAEDDTSILNLINNEFPNVRMQLQQSIDFYQQQANQESKESRKKILINLGLTMTGFKESLDKIEQGMRDNDENEFKAGFELYNQNIDKFNALTQELQDNYGLADYSWLVYPAGFFLVVSLVLFALSRTTSTSPADQLRSEFIWELFKSSLWALGGAAITYIGYLTTKPGGTFYFFYGPMLIGIIQFVKGIYFYLTQARPILATAKIGSNQKINSLLMSQEFKFKKFPEKILALKEAAQG